MKYLSRLTLCFLCIAACLADRAIAWDFPLDIDPISMKFYHGGANDALDICKNYSTEITVPEYDTVAGRNEVFAYVKGATPTVKVKFQADPPDTPSLTIDAINTVGSANWNLADTILYINGSGFSIGDANGYVLFSTGDGTTVPNSVQDTNVYWSWRVVAVGGTPRSPYAMGSTNHSFYTLLAAPQAPLAEPWTDVLDYACNWASGETTAQGVVYEITEDAYNNNFKNYNGLVSKTTGGTCYLGSLLQATEADCRDMSAVVQLFSNALGVERGQSGIQVRLIDTVGSSTGFYYKSLDPIGTPSWVGGTSSSWWNFHQVGYYNNSDVYDATTRLNQSTPRIPLGESINGNYKTDLYNNNVGTYEEGWTHVDDHQWSPQSPHSITNLY